MKTYKHIVEEEVNIKNQILMKLELVKETKSTRDPWYEVRIDGELKYGSWSQKDAMTVFNTLLKDPKAMDIKKEILFSEEINLSLDETSKK